MKEFTPSIQGNTALRNLYLRQIGAIREKLGSLHEDLQYDYGLEVKALEAIKAVKAIEAIEAVKEP
jgi:hypothetical protein